MSEQVLIIGAGASGMTAGIEAARRGKNVTILEQKEQPGKKLLITGNGRCNFTNTNIGGRFYRGHDTAFAERAVNAFGPRQTAAYFRELGVLISERNGYCYPRNNQAQTIRNALTAELARLGVKILTGTCVTGISLKNGGFTVNGPEQRFEGDKLLLACGSEAGVRDKNAFSAYSLLKKCGHHVYPAAPALVPLHGNCGAERFWDGVRTDASVRVTDAEGKTLDTAAGEVQFTKEGISGIPVFQISHTAGELIRKDKEASVLLDLLPETEEEEVNEMLRSSKAATIGGLLALWIPQKLVVTVLKQAGLNERIKPDILSDMERSALVKALKAFPYIVNETGNAARAQVMAGGADTKEFYDTCESRLIPGLYVAGELLDIDGLCGGYNLQFAWSTGVIAGRNI